MSTHPLIIAFTTTLEELGHHHHQHGKCTSQVLFQELYYIIQSFSNEGTERTKQPDQALGAGRDRTRHGTLASGPTSGSCLLGSCPLFSSLTEEKTKLNDIKWLSRDPQQGRVSTQLLFTDKTMMKQTKSETQGMSALGGYVDTMTLHQLKEWPQVPTRGHQHGPHWGVLLAEGGKGYRSPRTCDHLQAGHQLLQRNVWILALRGLLH